MMGSEISPVAPAPPPPPHGAGFENLILNPAESSTSFVSAICTDSKDGSFLSAAATDGDSLFSPSPSSSAFLDPPSYADVVFSDRSASILSHRRGFAADQLYSRISVSDPKTEPDPTGSGSPFVSYLVVSVSSDASATEHRVRRRFRDFVTLSDRLAEAYRGYLIPPRPDKNTVESQVMHKAEFVEQRRVALEKYLCRLAAHPTISRGDELKIFLQVEGKLPLPATTDVMSRMLDGAVKLPRQLWGTDGAAGHVAPPEEVVQPAKGGRDLLRIFKELKQSVTNDWVAVRPPVVEEDLGFSERKEKMHELELQLTESSQQAEALVKAQQDIGETLGELGLALIKLTKFESEEAIYDSQRIRSADTKRVATAAVKASRLFRELNVQTVKHLETLHEHLGSMLSVHYAFADRASALLTLQTLSSELSTLNVKVEKLEIAASKVFGGDRSRLRKIEELKETVRATEDAKNCAFREYERIKENNKSEFERFDIERREDLMSMLQGFVLNQVGYSEKIANVWAAVADETCEYAVEFD